jgi:hypothetical protein
MTGLWTNDRDTKLVEQLNLWRPNLADQGWARALADDLIGNDVVRVLDSDDTELVDQGAKAMYDSDYPLHDLGLVEDPRATGKSAWDLALADPRRERDLDIYRTRVRAVIEAMRQP